MCIDPAILKDTAIDTTTLHLLRHAASTSIAQFTPGASTPLTTTSPSLTGSDAASSIASHSSDGINSGNPSITTTGGGIQGISTGISGGYDTPAQTATTTDAAAGTQGGNSGVLQSGGGANEAAALNRACGASVVTVVVIAVAAVLL